MTAKLGRPRQANCQKCGGTDWHVNDVGVRRCRPCYARRTREHYHRKRTDPAFMSHLRTYNRNVYWDFRDKAYEIYGGRCVRCGFTDKRALHIDHVHDGGTKERATMPSPTAFLKKVIAEHGNVRYQILCANCNSIKRYESVIPLGRPIK